MMRDGEIGECAIIALTANNRDQEHENLCKEAGMHSHLSKPLQIEELEAILKRLDKKVVEKRRRLQQL